MKAVFQAAAFICTNALHQFRTCEATAISLCGMVLIGSAYYTPEAFLKVTMVALGIITLAVAREFGAQDYNEEIALRGAMRQMRQDEKFRL